MKALLYKSVRTVQSELFFLKGVKDYCYYYSRKLLSQTHEVEWRALKFIPNALEGSYVDVGANFGQSIESIKLMKPNARIYAFEPNPGLARKLQKRYVGRGDIKIFAYGLADGPRTYTLYVPVYKHFVYDGDASFDESNAKALFGQDAVFFWDPSKLEVRHIACEAQRLDDQRIDPIFVKIDVQGFEFQVLSGGQETIKRYEPVLMLEGFDARSDLGKLVAQLGYEEYLFDDSGFYRGASGTAVNRLFMTPRRASTVLLSRSRASRQ